MLDDDLNTLETPQGTPGLFVVICATNRSYGKKQGSECDVAHSGPILSPAGLAVRASA
jgi:hypothetical protein